MVRGGGMGEGITLVVVVCHLQRRLNKQVDRPIHTLSSHTEVRVKH